VERADGQAVTLTIQEGLAILSLNRPLHSNAIEPHLLHDLADATQQLEREPDLKALLVRGEGRRFSVGGDINHLLHGTDPMSVAVDRMISSFHASLLRMHQLDAPIVLAVHGAVAGGALGFLGVADVVIAADDTVFTFGTRGFGLPPDGGSTWIIPHLVGLRRAMQLYVEGGLLSAHDAESWGLVSSVVSADTLVRVATDRASRLADAPDRLAYRDTRELMYSGLSDSWETHLLKEHEAVRRFAARRPATPENPSD
jgi:2-(1,2-epoxy-1,2-dihydrophenyl)acetyl-CoA isomerase